VVIRYPWGKIFQFWERPYQFSEEDDTMIKGRYAFFTVTFSILVLYLTACQATVGGSGGKNFYKLKRSLTMPHYWEVMVYKSIKPIYGAVLAGIKDLGLNTNQSKVDELSGIVEGAFSNDTRFKIKLSYESPNVTLMRIGVGLTGNKHLSVKLFEAVEKRF